MPFPEFVPSSCPHYILFTLPDPISLRFQLIKYSCAIDWQYCASFMSWLSAPPEKWPFNPLLPTYGQNPVLKPGSVSVRGSRPGKNVQLTETEIRGLCLKSRELFLSQPILLELEAPLKICGEFTLFFSTKTMQTRKEVKNSKLPFELKETLSNRGQQGFPFLFLS